MELDDAITTRRSHRSFAPDPLQLAAVSRLLFAAQGQTGEEAHQRTIPSAGALYPLEFYLVVGKVEGLPPGVYHYLDDQAALDPVRQGDQREALMRAALDQPVVGAAPAVIVICADHERTTSKYRERGHRYVHMEVGHAAQNIYLTATALGLGTVSVGAFEDGPVGDLLGSSWAPLLIMPVGWPSPP